MKISVGAAFFWLYSFQLAEGSNFSGLPLFGSKSHIAHITQAMLQIGSLRASLVLLLLLVAANACPYLTRNDQARVEDVNTPPQGHPNVRRAEAFFYADPTSLTGAVVMAAREIKRLIAGTDGLAAKFVRLSFHDCVGGCDGCVDLSNPSNFGLDIPITALAPIVEHNAKYLTTGDVWALAGLVSAKTSQDNTSFSFPLQFVGRPHCAGNATTRGPNRKLPSAHFTTQEVVDYFKKNFNFSPQESVAILGNSQSPLRFAPCQSNTSHTTLTKQQIIP
jgi:Peroxidase